MTPKKKMKAGPPTDLPVVLNKVVDVLPIPDDKSGRFTLGKDDVRHILGQAFVLVASILLMAGTQWAVDKLTTLDISKGPIWGAAVLSLLSLFLTTLKRFVTDYSAAHNFS